MSTHSSVICCFLYVFYGNLALWIGQFNAIYAWTLEPSRSLPSLSRRYRTWFGRSCYFTVHNKILLFILLHLSGVDISRLAEGCTPLLWLQLVLLLPVLWTALKLKIDKKTKCSCYCFCSNSILLIIVNLLHAMMIEWLRSIKPYRQHCVDD